MVGTGLLHVAGKTGMPNLDQRACTDSVCAAAVEPVNIARFEFPAYDSLELPHPISPPSLHQQSWAINFDVLAFDVKRRAAWPDALIRPLAANAQVGFGFDHPEYVFLSPPLHELFGIGNGFEDASWRSRD